MGQDLESFDPAMKDLQGAKDMPISKYYGGHGSKVMSEMKDRYGEKRGERIFYATANKKNQNPEDSEVKRSMKRAMRKGK